jgi:hypothetical protein
MTIRITNKKKFSAHGTFTCTSVDASYFGTKTRVTMSEADNISSPLERPGRGHLA